MEKLNTFDPKQEALNELKNETDKLTKDLKEELVGKPGEVTYLNDSKDGKFKIYSYTVKTGGNLGGIKNQYENQIGPWVEGTQFTDVNGDPLNKNRFNAGETVYLRVPKSQETKNTPGKIEPMGNKKDKENRNWKRYSYKFTEGGTIDGVMNKRESQIGKEDRGYTYFDYCDRNGNKLKKQRFGKGETIYIRKPNTDIIDPTPDMTIKEIMNLSNNELQSILDNSNEMNWVDYENEWRISKYVRHQDKLGDYMIIKGKKVYTYFSKNQKYVTENKAFIDFEGEDYSTLSISIIKKDGNNYRGAQIEDGGEVYRGKFKKEISDLGSVWFTSEKYQ